MGVAPADPFQVHHIPETAASRRSPGVWWSIGLFALCGLWVLFCACVYLTGYTATVTVTGGDGSGFCDVVWQDPSGATLRGESDCYDEPVGSHFDVRVTGWPDAGDPTLSETYVGIALLFGLPLAAVGGVVLLLSTRQRVVALPHPATAVVSELRHEAALSVDRTSAALTRAGRKAGAVLALGIVGVCALAWLITVSAVADADLRENGITTVGTVIQVDPDQRLSPGGAAVQFTGGGDDEVRYVLLGSDAYDYVEDQRVTVLYDRLDPARFTIDDVPYEPTWTAWPLRAAILVSVVAGVLGIVEVRRCRRMRRLLRTHVWTPTRIQVWPGDRRLTFTMADGVTWRQASGVRWPTISREPRKLSGWGLPDEDPADVPGDQPAWWVCDGTTAVFSPDQGAPLVLARLRSEGALRRLRRTRAERSEHVDA